MQARWLGTLATRATGKLVEGSPVCGRQTPNHGQFKHFLYPLGIRVQSSCWLSKAATEGMSLVEVSYAVASGFPGYARLQGILCLSCMTEAYHHRTCPVQDAGIIL